MSAEERGGPVTVVLNGKDETLDQGTTVADLVERLAGDPAARGVAVALNGAVISRGRWRLVEPADGDRVEILTAVQGG